MHPHVSDTDCAVSSEQDFHGTLVVDSVRGLFPISALHQRFLKQMSVGQLRTIPFFLTHKPQACTFARDMSLS